MTEPSGFDLLELATPYALNAVSADERATIDRQLEVAPGAVVNLFGDEVRTVQEAMAVVSAATSAEPPDQLRAAILASVQRESSHRSRWRTAILTAAAAIIVTLAGFGAVVALRPHTSPASVEQIMAAPDVRTASSQMAGGTATVTFSRDRNAAVLRMTNIAAPAPGSVYQMWLIDEKGPVSAGTIDAASLTPSSEHMVHNLGKSSTLAFTVEPGTGSPQPTSAIIAKLSLR